MEYKNFSQETVKDKLNWIKDDYSPASKYIGSILGESTNFYTTNDDSEYFSFVNNIMNNVNVDASICEIAKRVNGDVLPSPKELLDIEDFFQNVANYLFSTGDVECKDNALDILIFLSLEDQKGYTDFTDDEFISCLVVEFGEGDESLVSQFSNLFYNLLSDDSIAVAFSERCFNNGLLIAFSKHFDETEQHSSLIKLICRFLEVSIPALVRYTNKCISEEEEISELYDGSLFIPLVLFFEKYINETADKDPRAFVSLHFLTDLKLVYEEIMKTSIPAAIVNLIKEESNSLNHKTMNTLLSLFNKLSERNPAFARRYSGDVIPAVVSNYQSENDSEKITFLDFIRIGCINSGVSVFNSSGVFERIISEAQKGTMKIKKETAFVLASIIFIASDELEDIPWIEQAIELVFDTLLAFKGERLLLILYKIRSWFDISQVDMWSLCEETDIRESLEDIRDSFTDDFVEAAESILEMLNTGSEEDDSDGD